MSNGSSSQNQPVGRRDTGWQQHPIVVAVRQIRAVENGMGRRVQHDALHTPKPFSRILIEQTVHTVLLFKKIAFAIQPRLRYQENAFQASSPKSLHGSLLRPFFFGSWMVLMHHSEFIPIRSDMVNFLRSPFKPAHRS
ncbi:MAG: hypothetical protein EOP89_00640 [Lysobacteraceae bacterium]|nr:MAG: hypothetical protein EOP89_00640 [Xanthomonadaceae bacterium]